MSGIWNSSKTITDRGGKIGIGETSPIFDFELAGKTFFSGVSHGSMDQLVIKDDSFEPFTSEPAQSNIQWTHNGSAGYLLHLTQGSSMGAYAALIGLGVDEGGRGLYVNNKKTGMGVVITQAETITSSVAYGLLVSTGKGAAPGACFQYDDTSSAYETDGVLFKAAAAQNENKRLVSFKSVGNVDAGYVTANDGYLVWNNSVSIGSSNPGSGIGNGLDLQDGYFRLADNIAANTVKRSRILGRSYSTSEEDVCLLNLATYGSVNLLSLGGGSSAHNGATEIQFNTATATSQLNPSTRLTIKSTGNVGVGTTSPGWLFHVNGEIGMTEKSSDPSNPSEGSCVMWMSDGTGTGDDGDIMIKVTAGGATKTATLVNFSEL